MLGTYTYVDGMPEYLKRPQQTLSHVGMIRTCLRRLGKTHDTRSSTIWLGSYVQWDTVGMKKMKKSSRNALRCL